MTVPSSASSPTCGSTRPTRSKHPAVSRLGVLAIADNSPRKMTDAERATLPDLAALVAREIGVVALASVDEPTGFLTWRGLSFLSRHELERASREGDTMSIVTVEVLDHDEIRRRFGGHAGDAALIEVADTLRTTLRAATCRRACGARCSRSCCPRPNVARQPRSRSASRASSPCAIASGSALPPQLSHRGRHP